VTDFRATLFFRASASCLKILNDKKYFNTVEIFRATRVFQGKTKLLKYPECKSIAYSIGPIVKNSWANCFSGQAQNVQNCCALGL